ncbi:MAG: hypothetical protein ACI83O_000452 [Patescibacteria group bacterium]|jgi:hypothetical protein
MNKRGLSRLMVGIILIVITMLLLITIFPDILLGFEFVNLIGGTNVNIEAVVNGCVLACQRGNFTEYCTDEQDLKLGNSIRVKGTCASLALSGLDAIDISCDTMPTSCESVLYPECFDGILQINCEDLN